VKSAKENGGLTVFCDDCNSRVVWVQGDCLIIRRKHHGKSHVTVMPLKDLVKLTETGEVRATVRSAL